MNMKTITKMIFSLGLATGFSLLATSCQQKKQETAVKADYKTMTVARKNLHTETSYSARIKGRQDIDIYPQVSGKIERLCVKEGEKVHKGQLLFVIDQVPYKAALNTALANERQAEAALATAELTYTSNKELLAQKVISNYTYKTSENAYLTAQAQVAQAKAQVVDARNNLSYTEVSSPSDGVVGVLPYRVGALVGPTIAKPLTSVSDNSEMYVYFSMTEKQLLEYVRKYGSKDNAIKNMPEISLQLGDQSLYSHKGRVESISGVIDTQTGTVSIRAVFPNSERLLNSGGSGNVLIPVTLNDVFVIPQAATVQQQDKHIVYKVVNGKAVSQIIEISPTQTGNEYVVTGGLKQGDVIVSDGAGLVHEGDIVKSQK